MAMSNVISRFSDIWVNDTAQQVTVTYVYLSPNPIYRYGRIFIYSLFVLAGSLGFLRLYLYTKETFLEIVCWIIGIGLFIMFTIFYSQGLWFERGLLYLFIPLALIISFVQHPFPMTRNYNEKNIIYKIKAKVGKKYKSVVSFLLGVIILSAPIACYFGYAEELPKIVPTSEVQSAEWATNFAFNGSYLAHKTDAVVSYYKPTAETLGVESWSWDSKTSFDEAFFTPPHSINSIITTKQFYGNYYPDYSNIINNLNNNKTLNRVYSNDFVLVYHSRSE